MPPAERVFTLFYDEILNISSPLSTENNNKQAAAIRMRATELGFCRVGFARAEPPRHLEFFQHWLSKGRAGEMASLQRSWEKRADPQKVLAGVRTIVSVAYPYSASPLTDDLRLDPKRGIIAAYAVGRDYHDVMLQKLEALAEFMRTLDSTAISKGYVDTGPVMERDYAEWSGLGFIGKNALLISPEHGSCMFLGEILTTLDIPPTLPDTMPSCGTCAQCITACPTKALIAPFTLDARRCISYLTIEYKGIIPRELRPLMGNHVFGCDDCQTCCPWNRKTEEITEDINRRAPLLNALADLSEEQFRERFAGTPIMRCGHERFLRNAAVALGNWRAAEALDSIEKLLQHDSPLIRCHAAWAAGRVRGEAGKTLLREQLVLEDHSEVRQELEDALT